MYSEKLKKQKIALKNEASTVGIEIDEKTVIEMINNFCKKEDIIGVQPQKVFDLFDEFCEKMGYQKIMHNSLGKVIKKHFNVGRKKVRSGKELLWVYVAL